MEGKLVAAVEKKGRIDLGEFEELIRSETDRGKKIEALCKAADYGYKELVEALIEIDDDGVDVDARLNEFSWTALMYAAREGHSDIAELLIEKHADVNAKDRSGRTSLWLAAYNGNEKIVEQLLQKNADVNAQTEEGSTPLIAAAEEGHKGVVNLLLNGKDIDVNVKDRNGKTACDLANNEIKALIINKFPELKGRAYKKEIERGAKIALPVAMVPAIGAIVISVLSETTNLIGNKPFTENKIAIITVSCLAAAAVIIVALGPAIAAIKIKTQIDAVKAESQASPDKAAVHTE
ncbi:MAG: ankyrin repeat domain-containing protein [Rickettsiaceae bacterium H1]|nr:ankyrin repeat domain-containing protein [Rickettsiaceae bacterium H1]